VLASVKVVEFRFGDTVIDVDGSKKKRSGLFHGIKTVNTSGSLLGNTVTATGDQVPLVGLAAFQKPLDDGQNNLEFGIVGAGGVRKSSVLEEKVFGLLTLMDKKSHITTVINDKVRSLTLAIIFGPGKGVQGALPVFLKRFSLPCENSSRFITSDGGSGVILGGKDVTRTPTDIPTQFLESLDKNGGLDGHVKGSRDTGSAERLVGTEFGTAGHKTRHLNLGKLNILTTVVG